MERVEKILQQRYMQVGCTGAMEQEGEGHEDTSRTRTLGSALVVTSGGGWTTGWALLKAVVQDVEKAEWLS